MAAGGNPSPPKTDKLEAGNPGKPASSNAGPQTSVHADSKKGDLSGKEDKEPGTSEKTGKRTTFRASSLELTLNPAYGRTRRNLANALELAVQHSESPPLGPLQTSTLALGSVSQAGWFSDLLGEDAVHKLFAAEDMGNYYIVRKTGVKQWEQMPLYARIGMHILFHGPAAIRFVTWSWIRKLLKEQSIKQGKIYDKTDPKTVRSQIDSFVATYSIDTTELLEKDLSKYPTFNSFFSRKLKPSARRPSSPNDMTIISAAADSRLMVFRTVHAAKKFWIKGRNFTIPLLLQDPQLVSSLGSQPSLAIFRLAPQDYHRMHSPISGSVQKITHIPGEYYTVNPQAINENLDVFTANTRSIAILDAKMPQDESPTIPIAFVAVGALLVGSIRWGKKSGDDIARGEDLGCFAYGGSTVIVVFPESFNVKFDDDLLKASEEGIEVLVRAAERIAVMQPA